MRVSLQLQAELLRVVTLLCTLLQSLASLLESTEGGMKGLLCTFRAACTCLHPMAGAALTHPCRVRCNLQAKVKLTAQLNTCWQQYQHRLAGRNFPQGDGQQLLPPDAVFAACSAEFRAAGAGLQQARGGGTSSSFAGAGSGLYSHLHSIYFQDAGKRQPR